MRHCISTFGLRFVWSTFLVEAPERRLTVRAEWQLNFQETPVSHRTNENNQYRIAQMRVTNGTTHFHPRPGEGAIPIKFNRLDAPYVFLCSGDLLCAIECSDSTLIIPCMPTNAIARERRPLLRQTPLLQPPNTMHPYPVVCCTASANSVCAACLIVVIEVEVWTPSPHPPAPHLLLPHPRCPRHLRRQMRG